MRSEGQERPVGHRAAASLTARLDAPARAGQVARAAVAAGGEAARVHVLSLAVGERAGALAAAQEAAWRDARGRAEQYAALAEVGLGRVMRIEELPGGTRWRQATGRSPAAVYRLRWVRLRWR